MTMLQKHSNEVCGTTIDERHYTDERLAVESTKRGTLRFRDGDEVTTIIARESEDADWSVKTLVCSRDELPDAVDGPSEIRSAIANRFGEMQSVIAATATLKADFGDSAAEDVLEFSNVTIIAHEATVYAPGGDR